MTPEPDDERLARIKREIGNPHINMRRLSIECGDFFWLLARLEAAERREAPKWLRIFATRYKMDKVRPRETVSIGRWRLLRDDKGSLKGKLRIFCADFKIQAKDMLRFANENAPASGAREEQ